MSPTKWDQLFISRNKELKRLKRLWTDVKSGEPRMCVLRGESGFGKTKIIQKFYSEISSSPLDDPKHYWPNTLLKEHNNLRVNPKSEDFADVKNIPWLWWGLRWSNPDERNRNEIARCGILAGLDYLKPHQDALQTHEKRIRHSAKVAIESAVLAADLASFGLVGKLKALYEFGKMEWEERRIQEEQELTVQDRQEKAIAQRLDIIMAFFRQLLDGKQSGIPALPVIIVLDDAQWIDTDSLNFIRTLLTCAIEQKWPLLILATHWEQEWNLHMLEKAPEQLPALYQHFFDAHRAMCCLLNIDRIDGLSEIIKAALTGLPHDQVQFLCERADGNPRLLHEIILELLGEPYYFERQNLKLALTEDAIQEMHVKSFALHDVQTRRFRRMHQSLQTLLSYASYQGMRFIKELVLELATSLDKERALVDNEHMLAEAIHPYAAVIETSAVIYEFRHRVFYDLAKARIDKFPSLQVSIADALLKLGKAWLQENRHENLATDEREIFYLLMMKIVVGRQDETAFERYLLIELLVLYQQQGYYTNALPWLEKLEQMIGVPAIIQDTSIPFRDQYKLILLLRELNRWSLAERLASALVEVVQASSLNNSENIDRQREYAVSLMLTGDLHLMQDRIEDAMSLFKQALEVYTLFFNQDEVSEVQLRDVSVLQIKVGYILEKQDKIDEALTLYDASLKAFESIVQRFGETAERLRDVSVSQNRVGDILAKQDKIDEALTLYDASLKACESIVKQFGETAERLSDLSVLQIRVGDILAKQDKIDEALALYDASLKACESIVQRFGETAERLRDVSVSQDRVGDILEKQNKIDEALALYDASLKACESIVQRFGETAERLRDVSVSQNRVGDILEKQDKIDGALALYNASLKTREVIVQRFGETAESLSDLSISQIRVGEILAKQDKIDEALTLYNASLKTCESIVQRYGETAERLRDVSVSQDRVGNIMMKLGKINKALTLYDASLKTREVILQQFGETAERLRDVFVSYFKLGSCFLEGSKEQLEYWYQA